MAEIHIPFVKGQHEEVDAKLLPQGMLTAATNVRFRRDARVAVRNAFVKDVTSGAPDQTKAIATAGYGLGRLVALVSNNTAAFTVPSITSLVSGTYTTLATQAGNAGGIVGAPTRARASFATIQAVTDVSARTLAPTEAMSCSDCVVSGGEIFAPMVAYSLGTTTTVGGPCLLRVDAKNPVSALAPGANDPVGALLAPAFDASATNLKTVVISGVVCIFWADSSDRVRMMRMDTSAVATVVTAFAGTAMRFDVSAGGGSTEAYLVYQSSAVLLTFGTVSVAGAFSSLNTIAVANDVRPSISPTAANPTDDVVIAWNQGATFILGDLWSTVYRRSTTSFVVATTQRTSGIPMVGYPVVGASSSTSSDWIVAGYTSGGTVGGGGADVLSRGTVIVDKSGAVSQATVAGMAPASKPLTIGTNTIMLLVDRVDTTDANPSTYHLLSNIGTSTRRATMLAQSTARVGDYTSTLADPRRKIATTTAIGQEPGVSAVVVVVPTTTTVGAGYAVYRVEYGAREEMTSATLNGQLFFSSGFQSEYDGVAGVPVGFPTIPRIVSVARSAGAGSLGAGDYQVVVVWEHTDANGFRSISQPSLPTTITAVALDGLRLYSDSDCQPWTARGLAVRIYRTLVGGTIFYEDPVGPISVTTTSANGYYINALMTASDATLATKATLYTQGARGGLSGILGNDAPPPARYIWSGSDRLIIGGMEIPSQYQLSKLRFDGEPMRWSNTAPFRGNVDGRITAVAEMDGTWLIFTKDSIWTLTGDGPDDSGAGGSFDSPRKLPTDIGCISAKSLLLTGEGIVFQGAADRMYLLPRGGGGPQFVGQPVRDTLTAFPYIAASAFDQDSGLCYWAICDSAASAGKLLVYDTRIGEWTVDAFFTRAIKTLAIYNGLLVIDGSIQESTSSYQDSDGSSTASVVPTLTTGDVSPFGLGGLGRVRRAWLRGEARDVVTAFSITLDVSYDSGKTFTENVTWPIANVAAAIGDDIDGADHMLLYPRNGHNTRYRWSWSTPSATEGIIFNGFSLEAYAAPGLKRNAQQART